MRGGDRHGAAAYAIARSWTYERDPRCELRLVADRQRRVLLGAWVVAPLASAWTQSDDLYQRAVAL